MRICESDIPPQYLPFQRLRRRYRPFSRHLHPSDAQIARPPLRMEDLGVEHLTEAN